jgi:hypothetical protein
MVYVLNKLLPHKKLPKPSLLSQYPYEIPIVKKEVQSTFYFLFYFKMIWISLNLLTDVLHLVNFIYCLVLRVFAFGYMLRTYRRRCGII